MKIMKMKLQYFRSWTIALGVILVILLVVDIVNGKSLSSPINLLLLALFLVLGNIYNLEKKKQGSSGK